MSIHVGTSGWNYPQGAGSWNGVFYPARRPRGFDELAYYAEHFSTVEVNSTFYRPPEPTTSESWLRRTPPSFGFSVKLYQKFTHPDMFLARNGVSDWDVTRGDMDQFRAGIDPLAAAGRLLAVLVQFPSSFHEEAATRDYLAWLLASLAGYPVAVELRHRTWSDAGRSTQDLLDQARAAWVLIDEPKFDDSVRQPLSLLEGTSALAYLRFHGRNSANWWAHETSDDRYNYLYRPDELEPFARAASDAAAAGRRVVAYMNNHYSAKAVANAAVLKHQLGDLVTGDYEREMVARYPELADVVRTTGLPL